MSQQMQDAMQIALMKRGSRRSQIRSKSK